MVNGDSARGVVYEGPERLVLREFPLPTIGPGDLLVEVVLCGVDGTELKQYRGEVSWINERAPVIFGDEIIGRVTAIGDDARSTRGLDVGDLVTVEAKWPCSECSTCKRGQYYLCTKYVMRGYGMNSCAAPPHLWGGYATHAFIPADAIVFRIPDDLPLNTALYASSVLANGICWTEVAGVSLGDSVAVIGPGPQGLGCVLAASQRGANVAVIGLPKDAKRLEVARQMGAVATITIAPDDDPASTCAAVEAEIGEVDTVIDTAGSPPAKELAQQLVRTLGGIVNSAVPRPLVQPVDYMTLILKQVTLYHPAGHPNAVERSLNLARSLLRKGIDVGDLVTHVYPLDKTEEALLVASYATDEVPVKVVIDPTL